MKCTRCRARAELQLPAHNAAFCRHCFLGYFQRQVERTIDRDRMFTRDESILVAVSGGKDSLALWDTLLSLGYHAEGLYLGQGIGEYSALSQRKAAGFAQSRRLPLRVIDLGEHAVDVPTAAGATRRAPCSACGTMKRHFFDQAALDGGFDVLATGHNLDDEAARLLGNVLRWQTEYLARQRVVLHPSHPKFVRKVRPLYRLSEFETAAYTFFRQIDYVVDECPHSAGATQLVYKEVLAQLEAKIPGTKRAFVQEFLRTAQAAFVGPDGHPPGECEECGMPAFSAVCSFCRLMREVERRRGRGQLPEGRSTADTRSRTVATEA